MGLGGGTFSTMNKVLPGSYIRFESTGGILGNVGERGIVAMQMPLNWGPMHGFISVTAEEFYGDSLKLFGLPPDADELRNVREVLRGARVVKVYRSNIGGAARVASFTGGGISARAKHSGIFGNNIRVAVSFRMDDGNFVNVRTYVNGDEVDHRVVSSVQPFAIENDFVSISGSSVVGNVEGALSGGANGAVLGMSYWNYLNAVEREEINVLCADTDNPITLELYANFTKRLREEEGVKIVAVMFMGVAEDLDWLPNDPNYEGIVNVSNLAYYDNARFGKDLIFWVAGQLAGAAPNESLTNRAYDGEYDIKLSPFTRRQIEHRLRNGVFMFYFARGEVRVLRDINSLRTFTARRSREFSSNRVVRVLDSISTDVSRIFNEFFIGRESNDEVGRNLFKVELINYLEQLQAMQAITNFVADDVSISQGPEKTDVVVELMVQPVDSMEKLYMTVKVV